MGRIFCLMGKSSSGKDTIYKMLRERYPKLCAVVPYTTRPIRENESDGVEYFFVDNRTFHELEAQGRVIESRSYDTKCGVWTYFTADDGQIDLKGHDYLMIGTLVSFEALKTYFGEENVVPVYVEIDDGIRLGRALEREQRQKEPKYAEMCRRFLADSEDFSEEKLREAGIRRRFENEDLERCVEEIGAYIEDLGV